MKEAKLMRTADAPPNARELETQSANQVVKGFFGLLEDIQYAETAGVDVEFSMDSMRAKLHIYVQRRTTF